MIYEVSFGVAALGYLALALITLLFGQVRRQSVLFAGASLVHALWAAAILISSSVPLLAAGAETARALAWAIFFATLLPDPKHRLLWAASLGGAGLLAARLAIGLIAIGPPIVRLQLVLMIELIAVVLVLCLVVSVFRAAGESERWSLKFLCFPLGGVFIYDLFLYAQMLSVGLSTPDYVGARSGVSLLALPLLFIALRRSEYWRSELQISRRAALYSAGLVAVGLYLVLVAGATLVMRHWDLGITPMFQIALLFASALLLMFLLFSGKFRANLKFWINRNFYARKYDYAHEWQKFMQTLAFEGPVSPIENRIIRACADLLEVPGGALWVVEGRRPRLHATWNYRPAQAALDALDPAIFQDGNGRYRLLYGDELAQSPLADGDAGVWLAVPLPHNGELLGFLLLARPRVAQSIDQEDCDLLLLIAYQCASYLAEKQAVSALEQEKQFARFNRQYAFVAHDIKNLVSQLAVMLKNFDKHADNPEFQRDMHATVTHAVDRMRYLLDRLARLREGRDDGPDITENEEVDIGELVRGELARLDDDSSGRTELVVSEAARDRRVRLPRDRFAAIFGHLLANAHEASGGQGRVRVHLDVVGGDAVLDVTDNGPGMSLDFVRGQLFAPFRSTKKHGFGVGAYQCREFAREHGGDLDAISSPGSGTTMRLRLPLTPQQTPDTADEIEYSHESSAPAHR